MFFCYARTYGANFVLLDEFICPGEWCFYLPKAVIRGWGGQRFTFDRRLVQGEQARASLQEMYAPPKVHVDPPILRLSMCPCSWLTVTEGKVAIVVLFLSKSRHIRRPLQCL